MTGDDDAELRARLARLDPLRQPGASTSLPSPSAHEIRERVMQTIEQSTSSDLSPAPRRRRWALVTGAAAASVALAAGAVLWAGGDDGRAPGKAPTTLALTAPRGDVMGSCVMFDVAFLRDMPVAFGGTVTAVAGDTVTLDVDRWYKGGSADVVTVTQPGGNGSVALDGVEFTTGARYLVAATEGTVNGCGFSGPASAELERAYAEAFGG